MIKPNTTMDSTEQAIKNFENIKESLKDLIKQLLEIIFKR
ncbi:unnamed protein product [marine sediment metagenome]|uniref:Uncharacterized protein n=1 Tax=marine sediment metagenome TaxID=412755 RepID=X1GJJ7_9ZZZZ